MLAGLSSDERYERLRALNGNQLFCDAMRLLPAHLRAEFFWFEKRADLEATLKHTVSLPVIQELIDKGNEPLQSLIANWSEGDEFWYYHSIPGDTGYALVREGRVVEIYTLEIWCV